MGSIKINTDSVHATANNIRNLNKLMRDDFSSVRSAIRTLDNSWDGQASSAAINKFNTIKSQYCDARYTVVDNYVNFLIKQVDAGYVQTEKANKSLADAFK